MSAPLRVRRSTATCAPRTLQGRVARTRVLRNGFTLVEVMVVLVIIGLIASVALPRWINTQDQALFRSLQLGVKVVKKQVDLQYHATGHWPTSVQPTWFAGNMLPRHEENTFHVPPIEVVSQPGKLDPDNKVLKAGVGGAFWYNRAEGIVRVRVAARETAIATAVRYNGINDRSITDLGNYEAPSGGGS